MLTDFGLNINVKVLNDTDGGPMHIGCTSCCKGRKLTPGQGLCFALRFDLQCIKDSLISLKKFKKIVKKSRSKLTIIKIDIL